MLIDTARRRESSDSTQSEGYKYGKAYEEEGSHDLLLSRLSRLNVKVVSMRGVIHFFSSKSNTLSRIGRCHDGLTYIFASLQLVIAVHRALWVSSSHL